MLIHGLLSALTIGSALTRELHARDPLKSQTIDVPAFTLPRPATFAGNWSRGMEVWLRNGEWSFARPEPGLDTQCAITVEIGESDRLRWLGNKEGILHFRFPGGKVRVVPQMVSGALGDDGLLFWTQQFGEALVAPDLLQEASFTVSMENPSKGGWERGVPLVTVDASGFETLRGTRLTHMWCQGEFLRLDSLHHIFRRAGTVITAPPHPARSPAS